jgi:hypothetical protein
LRRRSKGEHGSRKNRPGKNDPPEPVLRGANEHSCLQLVKAENQITRYMDMPFRAAMSPKDLVADRGIKFWSKHGIAREA